MTVAVVILNWNGQQHLSTYLPSVVEHSPGARIIVADNGSTDESHQVVKHFPTVEWLGMPENYGFAEGYNQALKQIEADIFVLLNSDVRVTAGWLDGPTDRLCTDSSAGAVQPKVLADTLPTHFEYAGAAGGFIDPLGYPYCRGRLFDTIEKDLGQYDAPRQIDWATGACCFVRATAWKEAGGLDGDYFAHMEEIDFCLRIRALGYTCWVEPTSTVYHLGGGTLQYASPRKTFLNFRNSLSTLTKNAHPGIGFLFKLCLRLGLDGVAGMQFLLKGQPANLFAIVKAHFAFYRRLPTLLQARRELHAKAFAKTKQQFSLSTLGPSRAILVDYFLRGKRHFEKL